MKQLQLIIILVFFTLIHSFAQVHDYSFNNNFSSNNITAPHLVEVLTCGATNGAFVSEQVTTTDGSCSPSSNTFAFNAGNGLQYNNAGFISDTYTIHIFFKFSTYGGSYARVIDFLNSSSDAGVYILGNCLNFYPNGNVGTCPYFVDGNYYLITMVRDGATNQIKIYANGILFSTYDDSGNVYASNAGTTPVLFFRDDNVVGCEVRGGNVRYISLSPTLNTDAEILSVYNNICTGILPIKLNFFSAIKSGNSDVKVQWQTTSEINASHYEVEHSIDGVTFLPVAKLAAVNKQGIQNYEFLDKTASKGLNYYRLKLIETGGKFTYSQIQKVSIAASANGAKIIYSYGPRLSVSPNWINATATLFSTSMQLLSTFKVTNSVQQIHLENFSRGIYFLRLKKENDEITMKILKQ